MGGSRDGTLKLYTEDAVVVSPEDYNDLVCAVNGLINNVFSGYTISARDAITPAGNNIHIHDEVVKGSNYTHVDDTAEVEVAEDGTYEITADSGFVFEPGTTLELSLWRYTSGVWNEIPGSKAFGGEVI